MRRSRGAPIVVCNCINPQGWPLAVRNAGNVSKTPGIENTMRLSGTEWLVPKARFCHNEDKTIVRVSGNCPQCNRFFDLRAFAEDGDDPVVDFFVALGEDHPIEIITPHISIHRTNKPTGRIAHAAHNLWSQQPYRVKDVPTKTGTYSLWVNCEAKHEFVKFLDRAMMGGWDRSLIPDWHPDGSEKQFDEWLEELEVIASEKHVEMERRLGLPLNIITPEEREARKTDPYYHRPSEAIARQRQELERYNAWKKAQSLSEEEVSVSALLE